MFGCTLTFLAGLLVTIGSLAKADVPRSILTGIPSPLNGVTVEHTFPNIAHPQQITVGEEVTALVAVRNPQIALINVNYITGSINAARNFRVHVQNLTTIAFKAPVPRNEERAFEFRFVPDQRIPPRDFYLALTVFYEDASTDSKVAGAQVFFNETIDIVEADRLIDTEAISLYLTLFAVFLGILYLVYSAVKDAPWFKGMSKKAGKQSKQTKQAKAPVVETAKPDKSDYLVGTPYYTKQKKLNESKKAK